MLNDVGDAGRVGGRGSECDVEHLVVVGVRDEHHAGTALPVGKKEPLRVDVGEFFVQDFFIGTVFNVLL